MNPVEITRATYDAIAAEYLDHTRDRSVMAPWLDRFSSLLPRGAAVLDLGGGPGFDASELRARGLGAVAVDLSLGMLRVGLHLFPGPRAQCDMRRLPFRSSSVQGVWANASTLHLPKPELLSALRETRRVLESPGLLFISLKRGEGGEWESRRYARPRWFEYWSAGELDAALRAEGFSIEESCENPAGEDIWLVRLASLRPSPPSS